MIVFARSEYKSKAVYGLAFVSHSEAISLVDSLGSGAIECAQSLSFLPLRAPSFHKPGNKGNCKRHHKHHRYFHSLHSYRSAG